MDINKVWIFTSKEKKETWKMKIFVCETLYILYVCMYVFFFLNLFKKSTHNFSKEKSAFL